MPMTLNNPAAGNLITTKTFAANITNNSAVLSAVSDFTGLAVGQPVTATGIESGAVIQSLDAGAGTVTLSKVNKGATLAGTICTATLPGPAGGVPSTPVPQQGEVLTDKGWDLPGGIARLYNYRPAQIRKFAAARGAAIAGKMGGYSRGSTGQPGAYSSNVLIFGDSKVIGNTPVGPDIPKRKHAPYYVASQILSSIGGYNCDHRAAVFGYETGGAITHLLTHDPRLAFEGSGWTFDHPDPSVTCTIMNNSTTDYVDFTPEEPVDSFDIIGRFATSGDQFSWAIDGGSATTISPGAGNVGKTVKYSVSAGTLGTHTLRLRRVAGTIRFVALQPKDSTRYAIDFINLGISGSTLSQRSTRITNANYGAAALNTALAPKLVIEQWGYTDIGDSATPLTSIATAITNYGIEVAQWKALGVPIIIATPTPWDDVNLYKDDASQRDYLRALRAFCVAQDLPLIEMDDYWGSWQEAVAAGFMTHYARPDPQGNADMGRMIANALATI